MNMHDLFRELSDPAIVTAAIILCLILAVDALVLM